MPLLKHAKKKLHQDRKRTIQNKKLKEVFKKLIKTANTEKSAEAVSKAFSGIDKAAKKYIIHKNKAARLKSALTKAVANPEKKTQAPKKVVKKASAKAKKTVKTKKPSSKK